MLNNKPIQNEIKLPPKKSIYLLPNLLTTIALLSGFFAIITSIHHHFNASIIALYIAMIMDTLDGRIARLTHTQSDFGAQYDSLSDMVAFGLAPPLIAYNWGLQTLGRIGWIATFTYLACVALRLARFNIQKTKADPAYFRGLPCPASAAVIIGFIWVAGTSPLSPPSLFLSGLLACALLILAALMVSNLLFYSFKQLDFKDRVRFPTLLSVVLLLILIMLEPVKLLLTGFTLYAASGPLLGLWRCYIKKRRNQHAHR